MKPTEAWFAAEIHKISPLAATGVEPRWHCSECGVMETETDCAAYGTPAPVSPVETDTSSTYEPPSRQVLVPIWESDPDQCGDNREVVGYRYVDG